MKRKGEREKGGKEEKIGEEKGMKKEERKGGREEIKGDKRDGMKDRRTERYEKEARKGRED